MDAMLRGPPTKTPNKNCDASLQKLGQNPPGKKCNGATV